MQDNIAADRSADRFAVFGFLLQTCKIPLAPIAGARHVSVTHYAKRSLPTEILAPDFRNRKFSLEAQAAGCNELFFIGSRSPSAIATYEIALYRGVPSKWKP